MVHIYYLLALALLWDDNAGGSLNPPKQSWQKAGSKQRAHTNACMLGAAAFAHNIIGQAFKAQATHLSPITSSYACLGRECHRTVIKTVN